MSEEVPIPYNKEITYFGKTNFRNTAQVFGIKRKDRRQHMYVLGKSGTGKSVLLSNLIAQNIQNGDGVCVVDPHGELVEEVIGLIPDHRVQDVIYFNPADTDFHIGFNVLQLDDPRYKHLVASGLMGIFTKIWANAWSSRMEYILNNAILALLDTPGTTLLGIPRILVDKDYRQMIIANLKDPVVKAFWVHEYELWRDQFRNEAIAPIQNKVGQFLSTSIIRNVVGQPKSTIDIFDIMNSGKIFLVNVSKGRIGEDNSALLGGMLITKIQLSAMERVRIPEHERRDFYLYVDEFQNFATDAFANILSEARKYRLNLIIAHQYTAQLVTKEGSVVRDAVFGNVGTMIIFRVGADDAEFLEKEFEPEFMAQDIVNLPNYHIYLKLMIDGVTSRPFSATTLPPLRVDPTANVSQKIIESSRKLYTRSREEIEAEINKWSGMLQTSGAGEGKFPAVCDSCKKNIFVPFEPIEGRPVYCKDCMAKIKSGELSPSRGFIPGRSDRKEQVATGPLAALGIEFAADAGRKTFSKPGMSSVTNPGHSGAAHNKASGAPHVPYEKKKSGPSPLLKGLLDTITGKGPKAEPAAKPEAPVIEVKKDTPPPMSLSALKKPQPSTMPEPVKVSKEASPEHMNALKSVLSSLPKKEPENQKETVAPKEIPKSTPAAAPAVMVPSTPIPRPVAPAPQPVVVHVEPTPVVVVVNNTPPPAAAPVVQPRPVVVVPQPVVAPVVPPKAPVSVPTPVPQAAPILPPVKVPESVVAPVASKPAATPSPVVPAPEKEENKNEKEIPVPQPPQHWQKRVAEKEVPEDVLRKVLEE